MDAINSSSFFHYRSNKDDFYKIIKKGFSFRYSFEPLGATFAKANKASKRHHSKSSIIDNETKGIAMPMVCFCDIPLLRATKHRNNYGDFCIGVDKDMMIKRFSWIINPIFYVSSEAVKQGFEELVALKRELQPTFEEIKKVDDISEGITDLNDLWSLIKKPDVQSVVNKGMQYFKVYFSLMQYMALCKTYTGKNYKGEDVCFYDEREWRVFFYDWGKTKWVYDTTSSDFEKIRHMRNKDLEKIKFFQNMICPDDVDRIISHIIVPSEKDVPDIIKEIIKSPTIFGHHMSMEKKRLIISRVTSFERIEKDY